MILVSIRIFSVDLCWKRSRRRAPLIHAKRHALPGIIFVPDIMRYECQFSGINFPIVTFSEFGYSRGEALGSNIILCFLRPNHSEPSLFSIYKAAPHTVYIFSHCSISLEVCGYFNDKSKPHCIFPYSTSEHR